VKPVIGRKRLAAAALGVTFALVAVACSSSSGGAASSGASGAQPVRGGTIREESPEFGWTDAFDPTGEYLGTAWGMMDQLLIRGLMTYKHVDAAQGGDTPVPDIAAAPPTVSADGLTYDFTLKDNVMWAPPLNRAVTADDFLYAFQRINDKKLVAQYGNYYCGVIKGMDCLAKDG
jgi:ABC-type transport system substrate-binding protein